MSVQIPGVCLISQIHENAKTRPLTSNYLFFMEDMKIRLNIHNIEIAIKQGCFIINNFSRAFVLTTAKGEIGYVVLYFVNIFIEHLLYSKYENNVYAFLLHVTKLLKSIKWEIYLFYVLLNSFVLPIM